MRKIITLISFFLVFSQAVHAKGLDVCFREAATKHDVPIEYLLAVSYTESRFKPQVKGHNKNGTKDYGPMQINSVWSKQAKKMGYDWQKIKTNPCSNIMFGGHILKYNRKRMGSWKAAIGAYNAGFGNTPKAKQRRARYYRLVMSHKKVAMQKIKQVKQQT